MKHYDFNGYLEQDIEMTKKLFESFSKNFSKHHVPKIKKVIFNDPATIVYWGDNTKTVVKCDCESFDPEKGLAMAISKKALGNEGNYYNEFKKWIPEDETVELPVIETNNPIEKALKNIAYDILNNLSKKDCSEVTDDEFSL